MFESFLNFIREMREIHAVAKAAHDRGEDPIEAARPLMQAKKKALDSSLDARLAKMEATTKRNKQIYEAITAISTEYMGKISEIAKRYEPRAVQELIAIILERRISALSQQLMDEKFGGRQYGRFFAKWDLFIARRCNRMGDETVHEAIEAHANRLEEQFRNAVQAAFDEIE